MEHLTAPQVTLMVAVVGIIGAFVGWLGRGITFLLTRWWTDSPKQERATYWNSVVDLGAKLRANGMTFEEVHKLEEVVQNPAVQQSKAANRVIEELTHDTHEPEAFHSNAAMKMRTTAAYGVAEAKLDQALMDLRLLIGEHEWEHLERAQEHWRLYRSCLEDAALREYQGGTHATLAMALVGMAETERRADEVCEQVKERAAR